MHWAVYYMGKREVIYIRTRGALTDLYENRRMISEGLAEGEKHGVTKFLIDDRDLTLGIGIADIYYLPGGYGNLGVSRNCKVAIVWDVAMNNEEKFKFYETCAVNLGYRHRLFKDFNAALDWLTDCEIQRPPVANWTDN